MLGYKQQQQEDRTVNLEITKQEQRQLDKALQLLRDRHYRNYYNAKDQYSETALGQLNIYNELETLRERIRGY
jgi:hypothetical protein